MNVAGDYFDNLDAAAHAASRSQEDQAAMLAAARDMLLEATPIVALTGAGISTESGIPDFRSPGGVWADAGGRPPDFDERRYRANADERRAQYQRLRSAGQARPQPNAGHRALAQLEADGRLSAIVTQNVDGLHQAAGSRTVHELHGSLATWYCLGCGQRQDAEWLLARLDDGDDDPRCPACGDILRATIVGFGETLPADAWEAATIAVRTAGSLLIVGTSLTVRPAADLPLIAIQRGVPVILIGIAETPFDDLMTVVLRGKAGELLPALM